MGLRPAVGSFHRVAGSPAYGGIYPGGELGRRSRGSDWARRESHNFMTVPHTRESARYTHGPGIDEPLAEVRGHRARFYHANGLGSVVALTGEHGHRVRDYRYSAFGVPTDHRGDAQPYRYTGREWDKEIDLYYYRARYYHPQMGRFLGPDPIPLASGARSLYAYVGNNPVNFVDPTGQFPLWLVPIVLITFLLHHGEANAPGPGDPTLPATDATGLVVDITFQVTAAYFAPPIAAGVWLFCRSSVTATRVANPVPKILARVIPGKGPFTALGRPGAEDVFVTAAEDVARLNAQQLAQRLGISQSKGFTVIEFPSAGQPIASPINRLNPGFSGGGRTVGGAREYVIPNQPIPPGAWTRIVE